MAKRKPKKHKKHKKRGRPPTKPQSEYMRRKLLRKQAEREAFDERMRKAQREPLERDRVPPPTLAQVNVSKTARWTQDLSWQSKPPPPEFIYMIIGGKPVRCRLTHMHNHAGLPARH